MKLNNKGFAISGVLYSLLILFVTLFIGILTILATTKFSLDKVKNDITDKLEALTYRDVNLNGADPVLKDGMIPVVIDSDGTVRKADMMSEWYDYDSKMWANAVTVSEENRNVYEAANAGKVIEEGDILTYFVWIPRYKYRLWYVEATDGEDGYIDTSKVHSIDIVFEGKKTAKSNGTENGQYLTHPAFTFGDEELNGIWVGKFETGYSGATMPGEAEISVPDSNKVIIRPNTYSWRNMNVSNMFYTALNMNDSDNVFGLSDDSDTHMMKNIEWGAVTYLTYSDYGKDSEVYVNNQEYFLTGCGGNEASAVNGLSCLNAYGTKTNNVYNQSTTGNISGIFDMSGGAYEYVMGYTTQADIAYAKSGFTDATFPESKYIDIYTIYPSTDSTQYSNRILGDATGELGPFNSKISSWHEDFAHFVSIGPAWFSRGGSYRDMTDAGIGAFYHGEGSAHYADSFRIVLT